MYFDSRPCRVCGAEVELRARTGDEVQPGKDPDGTVDERICTNSDCPTHAGADRA
jgi:hypothetical protein